MRVNAPCKDCDKRSVNCHSTCTGYKEYLEKHNEELDMMHNDRKDLVTHLEYLKDQKTRRIRHSR